MAKMGFEKDKRIVKVFNNHRVNDTVGGKNYTFKSKLERNWAVYLEFLKQNDQIEEWEYEPDRFLFKDEVRGAKEYTPDFKLYDSQVYYQETKGYHDGQTNTKLRRFVKYNPEIPIELVLQRIPKRSGKGANRRRVARKYARRIINASEIFKQIKGMIKLI